VSTRQTHRIAELATQAAALLPRPPADAINYLAWRELVWETARRLADLAGHTALPAPERPAAHVTEIEGSAEHLLGLAAMFQGHGDAWRDSSAPHCGPHGIVLD
jgi:hypothetical protein